MRVFRLAQDHRYPGLAFEREEDFRLFDHFDGSPRLLEWTVVPVVSADERADVIEQADFWTLGTIPVFSERAIRRLRVVLERHGELLPLAAPWGEVYALNVTTVRDALNEIESTVARFTSGEIMSISRFVFNSERLLDLNLFKIPQKPRAFVLVRETFVQFVRSAELVGFDFVELWHDGNVP